MKNGVRVMLLLSGDIAMSLASFFIMLAIAFPDKITVEATQTHLVPFAFIAGLWILIFFLFGLYETQSVKPTIPHLRKIGFATGTALAASAILFYIIPQFGITPKTNLMIFGTVFTLLFVAWRRVFYVIFASHFRKSVVFITNPGKNREYVKDLINYIEAYPQSGFFLMGEYASLQEFRDKQPQARVDTLIISKDSLEKTKDLTLIYHTADNIYDLTYAYEDMLGKIPVGSIDESWFLHNVQATNTILYSVISKILDMVFALLVLLLASPILIIVSLCIVLEDHGPIFYTQWRVGRNGRNFKLYKLRSMVVDSEKNGVVWANKNDDRITSTGKIIRKLHLDEIPQMINILKGDLSLVGPRPERPEFVAQLENIIPHYKLRHIICPGFTGWAQIKYRYANTIEGSKEKFQYDLYYAKNRNIFLDFGIVLRTIQIIFTH